MSESAKFMDSFQARAPVTSKAPSRLRFLAHLVGFCTFLVLLEFAYWKSFDLDRLESRWQFSPERRLEAVWATALGPLGPHPSYWIAGVLLILLVLSVVACRSFTLRKLGYVAALAWFSYGFLALWLFAT